jgi:hypothetical protein
MISLPCITIDPEFEQLLQQLPEEEYRGLEEDIEKRGCLNPIITWKGIIVDGHNRYQICSKLGIEFTIKETHFEDHDEAKLWIIGHQLKRRNLNDFQRGELALRMKSIIAHKAKENQRAGGGSVHMKSDKPVNTLDELADIAGISRDSLFKIEKIADKASKEDLERLRCSEVTINSAYSKLKPKEENNCDAQEKTVMTLIDGIESKVVKLEKMREVIPQLLMEKITGRLSHLVDKIQGLFEHTDNKRIQDIDQLDRRSDETAA